ncbi:MAG: glycosyltransferase family 2 protein [Candidatus Gorgyraea atricola]|nr:glycosyltransferase family 2 protein [Candidatus Gorgyraea atricola]
MATVSIGIICQDNENIIRDCLESAKWADEIVVVDAFSKDRTVEIVREYTNKIYQHKVDRHLNEQWNRAIGYATCDWFFHLSTDQRFTPQLRDEIRRVVQKKERYAAYYVPLENYFLGKWIQYCGWSPDYNIMFHKRDKGVCSDKEGGLLMVDGEIGYLKSRLIHYSHTGISSTISKENMLSTREAEYFLETKTSFRRRFILTKALRNFRKTYWKQEGYKDGMYGLVFCLIFSFNKFLIYAKYWNMLQRQKRNSCVCEDISLLVERENHDTSLLAERLLKERGITGEKEMRYQMTVVPLRLFLKTYIGKTEFRQGVRGLTHCIFNAYIHAIKWSKYWELSCVKKIKPQNNT